MCHLHLKLCTPAGRAVLGIAAKFLCFFRLVVDQQPETGCAHNAACAVGDTLWSIADKPGCYEVTDGGVKSDPADPPEPEPALNEKLEALQEDNKTLKKENEMFKQCLLEMSEIVYA